MYRAIKVFPNQCIVLHVLDEVFLGDFAGGEVLNSIDGDNADVFNCSQ